MQAIKIPDMYQFDEIVTTNEPLTFVVSGKDFSEKFFAIVNVNNGKIRMYFLLGVQCDLLRCAEIVGNHLIINEKLYSCKTPLLTGDNYTWRCLTYENDVNFPSFGHVCNEIFYSQANDTLTVEKREYFFPTKRLFGCVKIPRGVLFLGEEEIKERNTFLINDRFLSIYPKRCRINDVLTERDEIIRTRSIRFFLCLSRQIFQTRPIDIAGIPIMMYFIRKLHLILLCGSKLITVNYNIEDFEFFSLC